MRLYVAARTGEARGAAPGPSGGRRRSEPLTWRPSAVAPDHQRAELGEGLRLLRRRGVVRQQAPCLGREAERARYHLERIERPHHAVEPSLGVGALPVRPAEAGADRPHAERPHRLHRVVEPRILEMEPLAQAEIRRQRVEVTRGALRRAVLVEQTHVEVPVRLITISSEKNIPIKLWPYLVQAIVYIKNGTYSPIINKTPYEAIYRSKPHIGYIKILGSLAYIL